MVLTTVRAGVLDVAVERYGSDDGWPVVLLHGFPYDVRSYSEVATQLAAAGADVVVPYLRGYGPTSFVAASTMRSGQQAALAHDLSELITALRLDQPIVAGYDWGGRAACLVAMLWPDQVSGLVTVSGYNVQNIAATVATPYPPEVERKLWYQYYLHSDRGHQGLAAYRAAYTRLLWAEWSPTWRFSDAEFTATAASFDNADFVDVVVHSYRHRYALVPGDPAYDESERAIAAQPAIDVPTIVVDATDDYVQPAAPRERHEARFTALMDHVVLAGGHNLPQENPQGFAAAVLALHQSARGSRRAARRRSTPG